MGGEEVEARKEGALGAVDDEVKDTKLVKVAEVEVPETQIAAD